MFNDGWERYEPGPVKEAVPLAFAVGYLFGEWEAGPETIRCPLPGHEERTPSFNLWAPNDDGFPQRFGCFGCGANGDVIDLVRIDRGVGFTEACGIVVDELLPALERSSWTPPEPTTARTRPATPEELAFRMRQLERNRMDRAVVDFTERKGMTLAAEFAVDEFDWVGFGIPAPVMAFTHRDWNGLLTGVRYRPARRDGTRWTETGSRFPALYGAWRDSLYRPVLLCEGETDTVWAAWQLDGEDWDVLGLPAGAAQKPMPEALKRLAGRAVWLAFDGDTAGRIAASRWRAALEPVAAAVRTIHLPEGEDVLSCGTPVLDLLRAADPVAK